MTEPEKSSLTNEKKTDNKSTAEFADHIVDKLGETKGEPYVEKKATQSKAYLIALLRVSDINMNTPCSSSRDDREATPPDTTGQRSTDGE